VLEDVYGASPQLFGVIFGVNALVLVIGAQINAHLLGRLSVRRLLRFGLGVMVTAGVLLTVSVSLHIHHLLAVVAPLTLLAFSWGFIAANATALALTDHPHVAGTAAGLLGVSQSAIGAIAAPLVGIGGRGTALPMAIVVLTFGVISAIALKTLVKPRARPQPATAPARA
jgi:DHA1 family bicyclomycin/chloramphenicol resistance-like MFS transporter